MDIINLISTIMQLDQQQTEGLLKKLVHDYNEEREKGNNEATRVYMDIIYEIVYWNDYKGKYYSTPRTEDKDILLKELETRKYYPNITLNDNFMKLLRYWYRDELPF